MHQHLRKGQVEDAKQKGPRQTRQFALPASRSGEHLSSLPSLVTQNVLKGKNFLKKLINIEINLSSASLGSC